MIQVENQGAVVVFRGKVPLAGDSVPQAAEAMESSMRPGQPLAVLDLEHVPLIDSAGLELLVTQQETFERNGGCLKLAAANPLCRDIMRCTGLENRFELYGDVKAAVGSFVR